MGAKKFGLVELERYDTEVGFKKADVRTIKGVCAIVDLPLTVVTEAKEAIARVNGEAVDAQKKIADIEATEAEAEKVLKQTISQMKTERANTKAAQKLNVKAHKAVANTFNGEAERLEKLLKNFA